MAVALTLDEGGIPETAEGRIEIAKRILREAEKYGIDKKDIVFDTLTMTVSTDPQAATHTLGALRYVREQMGCHTVLGVSNISFGLPEREVLTSHFFTLAMENGLSAAIMNPNSAAMRNAYLSFCALRGLDAGCTDYIARVTAVGTAAASAQAAQKDNLPPLQHAILKGHCEAAARETDTLLITTSPLDVINTHVIPALDLVGAKFEAKTLYLPQLLLAAEAAKAAFERILNNQRQITRLFPALFFVSFKSPVNIKIKSFIADGSITAHFELNIVFTVENRMQYAHICLLNL